MRKCEEKKCKLLKYRKYVIACLKCEQEADNHYPIVKPQIIKPLVRNVPLEGLSDKEKIWLVAHIGLEMTAHRISQLPKADPKTISAGIFKVLEKLKRLRKGKNSQ